MSILTIEQVTSDILKMLDDIVTEEFPAEEREEAKVRILNAWSKEMFQGPEEQT